MEGSNNIKQDELRKMLYQQLRNTGLLSTLQSQLRSKLLDELKKQRGIAVGERASLLKPTVWRRVMNSLMIDYMQKCGFVYTLSVFKPEADSCTGAVLQKSEILQVLNINYSSNSVILRSLEAVGSNNSSTAEQLLQAVAQLGQYHNITDSFSQTEEGHASRQLREQLQQVEDSYAGRSKEKNNHFWEDRFLEYRKQCDERAKLEVEMQVQHIREVELQSIHLEESAKFRKQLEIERKELDTLHQQRLRDMRDREERMKDDNLRQQNEVETRAFEHRQRILREEDRLKANKSSMQQELQAQQVNLKHRLQQVEERERSILVKESEAETKVVEANERSKLAQYEAKKHMDTEYSEQRAQIQQQRIQLEQERRQFLQEKGKNAGELATVSLKDEQIRCLQTRQAETEARCAALQVSEQSLKKQLEECHSQLESLKHAAIMYESNANSQDDIMKKAQGAMSVLQDRTSQGNVLDVKKLYGLQNKINKQKEQISSLKTSLEQKSAEVQQARKIVQSAKERELKWQKSYRESEIFIQRALDARETSFQKIEEGELKSRRLQRENDELRAQIQRLNSQMELLKQHKNVKSDQLYPQKQLNFQPPFVYQSTAHRQGKFERSASPIVEAQDIPTDACKVLEEVDKEDHLLSLEYMEFKKCISQQFSSFTNDTQQFNFTFDQHSNNSQQFHNTPKYDQELSQALQNLNQNSELIGKINNNIDQITQSPEQKIVDIQQMTANQDQYASVDRQIENQYLEISVQENQLKSLKNQNFNQKIGDEQQFQNIRVDDENIKQVDLDQNQRTVEEQIDIGIVNFSCKQYDDSQNLNIENQVSETKRQKVAALESNQQFGNLGLGSQNNGGNFDENYVDLTLQESVLEKQQSEPLNSQLNDKDFNLDSDDVKYNTTNVNSSFVENRGSDSTQDKVQIDDDIKVGRKERILNLKPDTQNITVPDCSSQNQEQLQESLNSHHSIILENVKDAQSIDIEQDNKNINDQGMQNLQPLNQEVTIDNNINLEGYDQKADHVSDTKSNNPENVANKYSIQERNDKIDDLAISEVKNGELLQPTNVDGKDGKIKNVFEKQPNNQIDVNAQDQQNDLQVNQDDTIFRQKVTQNQVADAISSTDVNQIDNNLLLTRDQNVESIEKPVEQVTYGDNNNNNNNSNEKDGEEEVIVSSAGSLEVVEYQESVGSRQTPSQDEDSYDDDIDSDVSSLPPDLDGY